MAISDLDSYRDKLNYPSQTLVNLVTDFSTSSTTNFTPSFFPDDDQWIAMGGVVPTTAVVTTNADAGCIGQTDGVTALRLVGGTIYHTENLQGFNDLDIASSMRVIVIDRLCHSGGLSGVAFGSEQTTNLPTPALTRYTSGEGVQLGLRIWSDIGNSATTITVRYTNQAGTPNQVTPTAATSGVWDSPRLITMPLAPGDTGVRSVEGVTLAASTGSAGNFGVVLYKPLLVFPNVTYRSASIRGTETNVLNLFNGVLQGGMPEVLPGACLSILATNYNISNPTCGYILYFSED